MRRTKDNRFHQLERKMKNVDTSYDGVYKIFADLVRNYKEDKTAENRDLLETKLVEYAEYIKYGHQDLIPILFEANKALPASKKFPMYWLFVKDSDAGDTYQIYNVVQKPVWDYIPENLIQKMNTKPIKFEMLPRNAGLHKIMGHIASDDHLRPSMSGIEITNEGATATNAHVLLHIAGKKDAKFPDGIYPTDSYMRSVMKSYQENISDTQKRVDSKDATKEQIAYDKKSLKNLQKSYEEYKKNPIIDEKYPNWKGILPHRSSMDVTRVHLPFLVSVLKTLNENTLLNQTTHAVELILPQSEAIVKRMGFNVRLLEGLTRSFMMMGIEEVDMYYSEPSRAMIFVRAGDVWGEKNPLESMTFGLLMPVMLGGYTIETSSVKIVDDNELDVRVGNTQTKTITYRSFYGIKETPKKPEKKDDEKEFLFEKIKAFKMMYEVEEDADEKKFLKEKIEAFELLQEL